MAKEGGSKPARGILFLLSRLAILVVIIVIVVIAFFAAMNTVNINMVAKDALSLRAEVVLVNDTEKASPDMLKNFFTDDFLGRDPILYETTYDDFKITNYYQRVDVHSSVIWPWQTEVTVSVDDTITDLSGHEIVQDEDGGVAQAQERSKKPPAWQSGTYELKMVKMGDVWKIKDIKFVKAIESSSSDAPAQESSALQEEPNSAQSSATE